MMCLQEFLDDPCLYTFPWFCHYFLYGRQSQSEGLTSVISEALLQGVTLREFTLCIESKLFPLKVSMQRETKLVTVTSLLGHPTILILHKICCDAL